jgi:mercuric ion transport protein
MEPIDTDAKQGALRPAEAEPRGSLSAKMKGRTAGRGPLVAGGIAAILASTCCLGPLVLVALGVSGAWIGNLAALEPYRPIFIGVALVALFFAYRGIFRPTQTCKPGEVCAVPQVKAAYKILFWIVAALIGIAISFPYILPLFY